jgi:hypothetical protein
MTTYFKKAGIAGSLLVIITLIIALLKNIIGFVAFLTTAIQILLVLGFVAVFGIVGFMVFRAMSDRKKSRD